jgi:ADP-heptose:LPS heptosyltransferase
MPEIFGYAAKNKQIFRKKWNAYLLTRDFKKDKTIVIKCPGSIGDVFLTMPVVEAIKKENPTAAIVYQTNAPDAIQTNPNIDLITQIGYPVPCDRFIDLDGDSTYAHDFTKHVVLSFAEKAGVKVWSLYSPLYIQKKDLNQIDSLIPSHFGRFVLFEISDTWGAKEWPLERYGELGEKISRHGYKVVIMGVANKKVDIPYDLSFINVLDVMQSAALLSRAKLFVGHEGLIAHFAQSMRMPNVILYGCTSPELFNDLSLEKFRAVRSPLPCSPCRQRNMGTMIECGIPDDPFLCMKMITVDMVYEAVKEVLAL